MSNEKVVELEAEIISQTRISSDKATQHSSTAQADSGQAKKIKHSADFTDTLNAVPKHWGVIKILGMLSSPKLKFLRTKWSAPLWVVFLILMFCCVLLAAGALLVYKVCKSILLPYMQLLKKRK